MSQDRSNGCGGVRSISIISQYMQSYWCSKQSNINIIYNISVITITITMTIILANFGKYAISDCTFIIICFHLCCLDDQYQYVYIQKYMKTQFATVWHLQCHLIHPSMGIQTRYILDGVMVSKHCINGPLWWESTGPRWRRPRSNSRNTLSCIEDKVLFMISEDISKIEINTTGHAHSWQMCPQPCRNDANDTRLIQGIQDKHRQIDECP